MPVDVSDSPPGRYLGLRYLAVESDLSQMSLMDAIDLYKSGGVLFPSTLVVAPELTVTAYTILRRLDLSEMIVTPVPGLPRDAWMVAGARGIVVGQPTTTTPTPTGAGGDS